MKDKDCKCRVVPPPPQGPQGPPGKQGPQGPIGPMGIPGLSDPQSAFRAENNIASQIINGTVSVRVNYPSEIFDLNNEYAPGTSTFTPSQSGVYSICANVLFLPNNTAIDHSTNMEIFVNLFRVAQTSSAYIGGIIVQHPSSLCTIVQLQAGDNVTVTFRSSVGGNILNTGEGTNFEAARFPSP
ncbi:hypothetical protein [Cytobacillus sp. IB215316]|uniref:hypothetical protein n=1 Tax=Cytobacillus sp. IB215316 TaxID=3097354 RepID=UPI002A1782AE|nr:hypothetical protein [Cytobacillus sp. IB215316]MDX8363464.1 hypothetical protein [Cytobacillus sp. IB215316]